jgi:hypothetical protein
VCGCLSEQGVGQAPPSASLTFNEVNEVFHLRSGNLTDIWQYLFHNATGALTTPTLMRDTTNTHPHRCHHAPPLLLKPRRVVAVGGCSAVQLHHSIH